LYFLAIPTLLAKQTLVFCYSKRKYQKRTFMLQITYTPQFAGDYLDLDELSEALHAIVGDEDELLDYETVRLRVLT